MLYKFEGKLETSECIIPLTVDQMLLRGSSLRNTEYIYGIVVFTGHETKIMKNSVKSRSKFSRLETATNTYIIVIIILQFALSFVAAFTNTIWEIVHSSNFTYLDNPTDSDFMINLVT